MSIFKKIFGKSTKDQDRVTTKELETVKTDNVYDVFPILKPPEWIGRAQGAVNQVLIGNQENPHLLVGFAYDAPTNFIFQFYQNLSDSELTNLVTKAYENLENYDVPLEVVKGSNGRVLKAKRTDFSAEKILSQNFMLKAHELLDAESLMVSIPRRTYMMITPMDSAGENWTESESRIWSDFKEEHQTIWNNSGSDNAPILNVYFVVKNGLISGAKVA